MDSPLILLTTARKSNLYISEQIYKMKLPDVLKVSEKDLELGTTNSLGYIKPIIEPRKRRDVISEFKSSEDEILGVINGLKPIMITSHRILNGARRQISINPKLESKDRQEIETLNHISKILDDYLSSIKLYYISPPKYDIIILWKDKKYQKRALLLRLLYYSSVHDEQIEQDFQKEVKVFKRSIRTGLELKRFFFHYVTGTLLGYRPASIRGYYLSGPIIDTLYDMFGYDTKEEKIHFRQKVDKKIVKEQYALAREEFMKTEEYQIFVRDYPKFKKKCDEWIEYMLNDSAMFKDYCSSLKDQIKVL